MTVDLDALERRIATSVEYQHIHTPIVLALIAEVRASRKLVAETRSAWETGSWDRATVRAALEELENLA